MLAASIDRRVEEGWPHQDRARAALDRAAPELVLPTVWAPRFELDAVDVAVLTVVAAAEFDPAVHLVTGLLSGFDGPDRPTVALALELAGVDPASPVEQSRFGPLASLLRFRLVTLVGDGVLTARRLRLPERVARHLRGDGRPPVDLLGLLVDPFPVSLPGVEQIAGVLLHGAPLVWVHAVPGSAGLAVAAAAAELAGAPVLAGDLSRLNVGAAEASADGSRTLDPVVGLRESLDLLMDEAALTGAVLVLVGAERAVGRLPALMLAAVPVIAVSTRSWDPAWANGLPPTVSLLPLCRTERAQVWRQLTPDVAVDDKLLALRLTPEQIREAAAAAAARARLDGVPLSGQLLRAAAARFGRTRSDPALTAPDLAHLVLPEHTRKEFLRLVSWVRNRDEISARPPRHTVGSGSGVCALFSGPPGTGKTLAAHVLAAELGLELFQVELSTVVSKYIGESEKNLEKVFAEAETMNAVLFIDEADALFGSRSAVKDAHDRYANQEIAYLLQRMETFDGITVLATNLRGNLDPAFARRLHFVIAFPEPDPATRTLLWEHHLQLGGEIDPNDPVDTAGLATAVEMSGGDIRNVVLAACHDALAGHEAVGHRHISIALTREMAKLGRRAPPDGWNTRK